MTAIDINQLATDSTDTVIDYEDATTRLPDFGAFDEAFGKVGVMLNNFFAFKNHPRIPFYDTPQGTIFSSSSHKKVQIKRRILEYRAKY